MSDEVRDKIRQILNSPGWTNPYLLDEIKDEYDSVPPHDIDGIYFEELKSKLTSMPHQELQFVLSEQEGETDSNRNFLLIELIEGILHSN